MKIIPASNYIITPFRTNKSWQYNYSYLSGSNPTQVSIDLASEFTNINTFTSSSLEGSNSDGLFSRPLYKSIQHLFYTGSELTSKLVLGNPKKLFFPTGSHFYVVNIAQQTYGESIRPGTVTLTSGYSTASILDDGNGHLYSNVNSNIVGNIIYKSGVAIIAQDTGSYSSSILTDKGLFLNTGSIISINYDGIHTIYEHRIICTMEAGEFNFSSNPTVADQTLSGSFTGSSFIQSTNGPTAIDLMSSGTLEPYFTQIGLYNDQNELMAVAKFPQPLRRAIDSQQTIIIQFDR